MAVRLEVTKVLSAAAEGRSDFMRQTAFIADRIHRGGYTGTVATILRHLKGAAASGLLQRSEFAAGGYGYTWCLTDDGCNFLADTLPSPSR